MKNMAFKFIIAATLLIAIYSQNNQAVMAHRDLSSLTDESGTALMDRSPDRLARALNDIEPSN